MLQNVGSTKRSAFTSICKPFFTKAGWQIPYILYFSGLKPKKIASSEAWIYWAIPTKRRSKSWLTYPIGSMYGIFTYIWLNFMVNVGKYTIHGSYGYETWNSGWYLLMVQKSGVKTSWGIGSFSQHLQFLTKSPDKGSMFKRLSLTSIWPNFNLSSTWIFLKFHEISLPKYILGGPKSVAIELDQLNPPNQRAQAMRFQLVDPWIRHGLMDLPLISPCRLRPVTKPQYNAHIKAKFSENKIAFVEGWIQAWTRDRDFFVRSTGEKLSCA